MQNRPRTSGKSVCGASEHLSTRESCQEGPGFTGPSQVLTGGPFPPHLPCIPSPQIPGICIPQIPAVDGGQRCFPAGLHPGCLPSPLVPSLSHPQGLAPSSWVVCSEFPRLPPGRCVRVEGGPWVGTGPGPEAPLLEDAGSPRGYSGASLEIRVHLNLPGQGILKLNSASPS